MKAKEKYNRAVEKESLGADIAFNENEYEGAVKELLDACQYYQEAFLEQADELKGKVEDIIKAYIQPYIKGVDYIKLRDKINSVFKDK